jgi:hypothetical protein
MTETAKNSENVTLFPIQIRETDDTSSDAELILQMKLVWANALNKIVSGEIVPTELERARYKAALDDVNIRLIRLGYSPIYHDF